MDEADIINYVVKRFPEVSTINERGNLLFSGYFIIEARHGSFNIHIAPKLELLINRNFPQVLPVVYDKEDYVENFHKNSDGSLCLATEIDMLLGVVSGKIEDYFDKFLIPYFLSYEYFKKYGIPLFGERKHGIDGIFQSLSDYFDIDLNKNYDFIFNLFLWTSKKQKFSKIFRNHEERKKALRYSEKVKKLRSLGIIYLRKNYRLMQKECTLARNLKLNKLLEKFK
ncbi:MAG: hypothetical protein HDR33_09685 [Treponema sp.]|nr:hypothetical protein [Treponema sp.]